MNNKKNGFSLIKMILACLVIAFFVFLVMLLVARAKKSNCDDVNNSNSVFNKNMMYLQQVGSDFFIDDRLPKVLGETVKISLQELIDQKYALAITDKNGVSCSNENSYVSVTKTEKGYEMKAYLECGNDSNYTIKDVVPCNCENACTCNPIVENEFVKKTTKTVTTYSCPNGYKLSGKKCVSTKIVDTKNPIVKPVVTIDTKPANKVVISGTKTKVDTIVNTKTETVDSTTTVVTPAKTETIYVDVIKKTTTNKITTDALKKTEQTCKTVTENKPGCVVQCKVVYENGIPKEVCNSCTITYKKCTNKDTWYCPNTYNASGSGKDTVCYKYETKTTYSCPSNATHHSGSGSSLKCWYVKTTPAVTKQTCPSGYTLSNNKCTKKVTTYSCPSNSNYSEGTGANLKCYVVTSGKYSYNCNGLSGYTLSGTTCIKKITTSKTSCPNGYKLEGNKCNKYSSTTKKATAKKSTKTIVDYKWSAADTLKGYTKTGKTREVPNKACNK